ncbi:hypothetical protein [Hymenobacter volaticus]|uniref:Lipoprotein n=1 Tax=Hymenobacter volaticus TaxID=2932254 RepID=A0ABY4G2X7_9BACT|nr:hypothetical protein [Hymenobacter volaticus]UOQ65178.1 hypothetical protein MUN86_16670 [Hymenobacter volaticus]
MRNKYTCIIQALFLVVGLNACQKQSKTRMEASVPAVAVPANQKLVTSAARKVEPTAAPDSVQQLAPFIPTGYNLLEATSGDLNLDALPDKVLVLQRIDPDTSAMGDTLDRPLLLLLGQPNHRYQLAARNDRAVMCSGCGGMMGDPYQGITIKKGFFSVEHYGGSGWRWTHISTFKYAPADKQWYLHREGGDSFHAADPEKVETHIETVRDFGQVSFADYDYEKRLGE